MAVAIRRGDCLDDWPGNNSSVQAVDHPFHREIGGKFNGESTA
jgi:hypothetical protein